jgi:SMC interacting uncharacterized protein involved in chromosome segregation
MSQKFFTEEQVRDCEKIAKVRAETECQTLNNVIQRQFGELKKWIADQIAAVQVNSNLLTEHIKKLENDVSGLFDKSHTHEWAAYSATNGHNKLEKLEGL